MDYNMEDTQNFAPGVPSMHETNKLSGQPRTNSAQTVTKRLQSELLSLMMSSPPTISAFPSETSLTTWSATIQGPDSTPYEGLNFKLRFEFPSNYPYAPPTVLFRTPIYHPNVDFSGRICLDILKDKWSAVLNVLGVLLSLQSLLGEPNNASPLNGEAAELWDKNPAGFKLKVLARHVDLEDDEE
ncbi:Ubiquitin-conjugating enzyme E2 11 [Agyrium rufum]|nr:Ubiquitin-conjugating enzyme E2 11 [Agyrium rufum]